MSYLGQNIKMLRNNKGLTQEQLAVRVGTLKQNIHLLECKNKPEYSKYYDKMAEFFGYTLKELRESKINPIIEREYIENYAANKVGERLIYLGLCVRTKIKFANPFSE